MNGSGRREHDARAAQPITSVWCSLLQTPCEPRVQEGGVHDSDSARAAPANGAVAECRHDLPFILGRHGSPIGTAVTPWTVPRMTTRGSVNVNVAPGRTNCPR